MNQEHPSDEQVKMAYGHLSIPEPHEETKKATLAQAMVAFDEELQKSFQGSSQQPRLNKVGKHLLTLLGDWLMNVKTLSTVAVVAAASVALFLAVPSQLPWKLGYSSAPSPLEEKGMAHDMVAGIPAPMSAPMSAVMPAFMPTAPKAIMADQQEVENRFRHVESNPLKQVHQEPVSTFSVDVDTASYAFVRSRLQKGELPPADAVRVEEMINYFDYDYPLPPKGDAPFAPLVKVYPAPWNPDTHLLHIGIQGYDLVKQEKPRSNLVFLIDVSGSMDQPNKLPLLKSSLLLLLDQLQPEDRVAVVVYASAVGVVLEPTLVAEKEKIRFALEQLKAGGSTSGGEGLRLAYSLAEKYLDDKAVNRVMLATDGDFNVGITQPEQLKEFVSGYRKKGIYLSVLGFGQDNYNDYLMQELAQNGNGVAAYIDTLNEGRKVLVEQAAANLFPIAKDVKIQVEFNPAQVAEYRLIGYETRSLRQEDFNNDQVDAGEIGAGHRVTALYEIALAGSKGQRLDPLRYGKKSSPPDTKESELAFVKIRYTLPKEEKSRLIQQSVEAKDVLPRLEEVPAEMRFAAAVAAFGQKLTGGRYLNGYGYPQILDLAEQAKGKDSFGYRSEFLNLVRLAQSLDRR
ncbi:MAG: DUF3520 domain-containing protein [Magnetococcales bacterium]|nr:von Willebrand factor type A domain-containing protein [Magnetococcales bacterium]NGZ26694.1 DUF3520 domain-containing protein [Magnetococcales bacterium]